MTRCRDRAAPCGEPGCGNCGEGQRALEHNAARIHSAPTAGSEAGADRIRPHARRLADRILEALREAGDRGLTNGELSRLLRGRDVTVWPRVSSLKERGKLRDSGRTRPSPETGTPMAVWILTTPEEEAAILEARRARPVVEPPGQEALEAAREILGAQRSGGMFWSEANVARLVQAAINARLSRRDKAAAKLVARHGEGQGG